jgi:hypothetical protein
MARAGFTAGLSMTPNAQLNPSAFKFNGINQPIGLPPINVAGAVSISAVHRPSHRAAAMRPLWPIP